MTTTRRPLTAAVLAVSCVTATLILGNPAAQAVPLGPGCPALYVLGVQGTGQSSPTADPLADTGVVGALLGPVAAAEPGLVQRAYLPYEAGFGGAVPGGGAAPYVASVTGAVAAVNTAAAEIAAACPQTLLAGVGYSQGAHALSEFARTVGAGQGPVPADRVAGIALYSDPDRAPDAPVFPGRPGQLSPDPAPGTDGAAVAAVQIVSAPAAGSGIAAHGTSYGDLTGRVADICVDGDLSCAAPDHAALLRIGAEIAAQADLHDPLAALGSLHGILSGALGDAWTMVLANDFRTGPGIADYAPQVSLAQRLLDAADPRTPPPAPDEGAAAARRWAEITAAVTSDPAGVLPRLAGQLSAAWGQLVADNAALTDPGVWARFADTVARHTGYATTGQLASGIAWMTALAHDLAGRTQP
ncbi:cutinase family protein [Nocardia wallacei]|uniref:cutinase family protein n=1 Tax=Nocardia wallacei TaxID=480035 RepID=UPI0024568507|nr:cutinase family protein [Nocardia wallacei]